MWRPTSVKLSQWRNKQEMFSLLKKNGKKQELMLGNYDFLEYNSKQASAIWY